MSASSSSLMSGVSVWWPMGSGRVWNARRPTAGAVPVEFETVAPQVGDNSGTRPRFLGDSGSVAGVTPRGFSRCRQMSSQASTTGCAGMAWLNQSADKQCSLWLIRLCSVTEAGTRSVSFRCETSTRTDSSQACRSTRRGEVGGNRRNVLVEAEQVVRVVATFHGHQPIPGRWRVGLPDSVITLISEKPAVGAATFTTNRCC